jgi:hypothetical protein
MSSNKAVFVCPVCLYPDLDEAPYDSFGCASFTICPCCGTEFGYDDSSITHLELHRKWVAGGMKWWSIYRNPPSEWNAEQQLKHT